MINDNKFSAKGITIWLICALFFMYEFLLRTVLGTFQFPLMSDLGLTPMRFALLSATAYQIIFGFMQIPVGLIVNKFGLKLTLFCAAILCAIANAGFAMSHSFYVAIFFRMFMGLGSSFGFVCLLVAVYEWLPRKNIALFIGISQFIGTLGPMLAAGPLNMVAETKIFSWRELFLMLSGVAVFIAMLVLIFVEKNRQTKGKFIILSTTASVIDSLKNVLKIKQIWCIALFSAAIYFSIEYLSENESSAFLISKGFSATMAAYMITIAWLGYAIGCPMWGYISDKLQKRKPIFYIAGFLELVALLIIIYIPASTILTAFCFILLGLGTSGQSVGFAIMAENCKEEYLAIGLAFNNAMIAFFSAFNAPLIGEVLDKVAKGATIGLKQYQIGFVIMPLLVSISIILAIFFIKETFCKSVRENTPLNV